MEGGGAGTAVDGQHRPVADGCGRCNVPIFLNKLVMLMNKIFLKENKNYF
jgi:hypothetical protein